MTPEMFEEKLREMITDNLVETVVQVAMRKVSSGGVDLTDFEDNFLLPKIVLYSTLQEIAESQYRPLYKDHLKIANNLSHF